MTSAYHWAMTEPKVVLLDLETLPNLPEALKVWPSLSSFPGQTLKASVSTIVCAGWKLLGSDQTNCISAWDFDQWSTNVNDDRQVVEGIYNVLKDADCVITHNGKRFDWKFLQTRLMFHKMEPLPKIHHIDTCAEAKRELYVLNNRLQTVARFLTNKEKMEHEGWDLWVKVHGRDVEACEKMKSYCMQDVDVLEAVYRSLRPVVRGMPNHNLFSPLKEKACPKCGSSRIRSEGKRHTLTRSYRRYICQDCRSWCHTDLKDEVPR